MTIIGVTCLNLNGAIFNYNINLTTAAVVPTTGPDPALDGGTSGISGTASFTYDNSVPSLAYTINLFGTTFTTEADPSNETTDNVIHALHLHVGGVSDNGQHALNIFGLPREDDTDMTHTTTSLSGSWTDADENFGGDATKDSGDSFGISSVLGDLVSGNLYLQAHSPNFFSGSGLIRGQLTAVPEPSTYAFITGTVMMLFLMIKRKN